MAAKTHLADDMPIEKLETAKPLRSECSDLLDLFIAEAAYTRGRRDKHIDSAPEWHHENRRLDGICWCIRHVQEKQI